MTGLRSPPPTYVECFVSIAVGLAPLCLLLGVAALFGADTVTGNGQNVHGFGALLTVAIINVAFATIFAAAQKLGYAILGVMRRRA